MKLLLTFALLVGLLVLAGNAAPQEAVPADDSEDVVDEDYNQADDESVEEILAGGDEEGDDDDIEDEKGKDHFSALFDPFLPFSLF